MTQCAYSPLRPESTESHAARENVGQRAQLPRLGGLGRSQEVDRLRDLRDAVHVDAPRAFNPKGAEVRGRLHRAHAGMVRRRRLAREGNKDGRAHGGVDG